MSHALRQALEDWHRSGVTDLPVDASRVIVNAVAALAAATSETDPAEPQQDSSNTSLPSSRQIPSTNVRIEGNALADDLPKGGVPADGVGDATPDVGTAASRLLDLRASVAACTRCHELANTRTQTVFGVGSPDASIMFIGEAPGADEDRVGEPFVGRAGQLLDRIIAASGWSRDDLYICNILRCRPPNNRSPSLREADNCREFLDAQISAVRPDWIICWGSVAAKNLLSVDQPIGRMRQRLYEYANAKVLCTYHPSYLLRNPSAKKDVWNDLKFLFHEMGYTPPKAGR